MRSTSANLSYAEYFEVEVLLISFSVILLMLVTFVTVSIFIVRVVRKILQTELKVKIK